MARIFISHSSADNEAAKRFAGWLTENGWDDYFLDIHRTRRLNPGERWQEALKAAADRCEAVVFLITPAWRDSRWCLAEFLLAKQLGKTIFGVLIEPTPLDTLPTEMTAEWQIADWVNDEAEGKERLKIGLEKAGLSPSTFRWPPEDDPDRAPYRGLKPLEEQDAPILFGRDAEIFRGLALSPSERRGRDFFQRRPPHSDLECRPNRPHLGRLLAQEAAVEQRAGRRGLRGEVQRPGQAFPEREGRADAASR